MYYDENAAVIYFHKKNVLVLHKKNIYEYRIGKNFHTKIENGKLIGGYSEDILTKLEDYSKREEISKLVSKIKRDNNIRNLGITIENIIYDAEKLQNHIFDNTNNNENTNNYDNNNNNNKKKLIITENDIIYKDEGNQTKNTVFSKEGFLAQKEDNEIIHMYLNEYQLNLYNHQKNNYRSSNEITFSNYFYFDEEQMKKILIHEIKKILYQKKKKKIKILLN